MLIVRCPQLGEGVELTLGELRAMALRQQQQIDTQHQLLCAKEQRLRYLKQQEARQHQVRTLSLRLFMAMSSLVVSLLLSTIHSIAVARAPKILRLYSCNIALQYGICMNKYACY